jgi:phosphoglycerol transferase MdoB-like AlkP superfamily enzyme
MKQIIVSLLKQLLFWMLFFALARLIFLVFYLGNLKADGAGFFETLAGFYHALKLDFATACYLMVIPFFLLFIQSLWKKSIINTINKIYTLLMILMYALITGGELGLYGEWKTKLNYKALRYLEHPSEVFNSASTIEFFALLMLVGGLTVFSFWMYRKFFYKNIHIEKPNYYFSLIFLLITPPFILVGMRGGVQQIPIIQSQSYYSDKNILNLAATNNAFNLYISIKENIENFGKNPYNFYDLAEAKKTVKQLYTIQKDTTIKILTTNRPNFVILMLESWSSDLIESLGGEPGITPEFRKLEQGGILFNQILSSGSRSEQGMASIFGGFPAHPISAITKQPDKFVHLPSLVHIFNDLDYATSFYFGGQLIYGNIKGYIIYNGFKRIIEGDNFDKSVPQGKLGVHDEFTLDRLYRDLNNEKQPFFAGLFTLSSHSPYDQPMKEIFDWGGNENHFINSAYYADHCLGEFFEKARTQPWFDNTLFILTADHSHNSYKNWPYHTVEYHSIPVLFYGNVIKVEYRGIQWEQPGSQVDFAATILAQMELPHDQFNWSRNLFNPYAPKFRYFGFDNGVIWTEPGTGFSYDADLKMYYWKNPENIGEQTIKNGKSYLQVIFQEYVDY